MPAKKVKVKTITLKDFVEEIAYTTGQTRDRTKTTIQLLLTNITQELEKGRRVMLQDFGIFEVQTSPARMASHPYTHEPLAVPARKRVYFRVGKKLKGTIRQS